MLKICADQNSYVYGHQLLKSDLYGASYGHFTETYKSRLDFLTRRLIYPVIISRLGPSYYRPARKSWPPAAPVSTNNLQEQIRKYIIYNRLKQTIQTISKSCRSGPRPCQNFGKMIAGRFGSFVLLVWFVHETIDNISKQNHRVAYLGAPGVLKTAPASNVQHIWYG